MIRICIATILLVLCIPHSHARSDSGSQSKIRRFVLSVGANNGGEQRVMLRYAGADAARLAKVTRELGGVAAKDLTFIDDSQLESLELALDALQEQLLRAQGPNVRVEVLFFYSGHSDETGLLLGGQHYSYTRLRERIASLSAEVKIAILDSCASGAFTRSKGGTRRPAFLSDESSRVQGYAFIASSSATELAQESDRIASSFFTHFFVSGLRGGADSNRDGRVTLNEAYQYAFDETVLRTAQTQGGTQHPAYNMHLAGTGDVVISDLRSTSASLVVDEEVVGRLFIRDTQGNLVLEITKKQMFPMTLGLAPEQYTVLWKQPSGLFRATVKITKGAPSRLGIADFRKIASEKTVARGGTGDLHRYENVIVGVSLVPGVSTSERFTQRNLSLNVFAGRAGRIAGVEVGAGVNLTDDRVRGLQVAGIANLRGGRLLGVQMAGIANWGGADTVGAQLAGVGNYNHGMLRGAQLSGVGNYNHGMLRGGQLSGVANFNVGDTRGWQLSGVGNYNQGVLRGAQLSGVANFNIGETRGWQLSGVGNYNQGKLQGVQASGIANYAEAVHGWQASGILNVAHSVSGGQISLVNIARGTVHGLQLGLVNVAAQSDHPIGLINIIKNGYRSLDAWTSDGAALQMGYKMGGRRLYSLFALSQEATDELPLLGYGLGVHTKFSDYYVDVDLLTFSRINNTDEEILGKFRVAIGGHLSDSISLLGGISANGALSFDGQARAPAVIHGRVYVRDTYSYRFGLGFFAGVALGL